MGSVLRFGPAYCANADTEGGSSQTRAWESEKFFTHAGVILRTVRAKKSSAARKGSYYYGNRVLDSRLGV